MLRERSWSISTPFYIFPLFVLTHPPLKPRPNLKIISVCFILLLHEYGKKAQRFRGHEVGCLAEFKQKGRQQAQH